MPGNFNALTGANKDLIKNDYYGQIISTFGDSVLGSAKVPADLSNMKF